MQGLSALKRAKVVKTIARGVTIGLARLRHTFRHHLSGGIFVVRIFFFFFFTIEADGLMIDNG